MRWIGVHSLKNILQLIFVSFHRFTYVAEYLHIPFWYASGAHVFIDWSCSYPSKNNAAFQFLEHRTHTYCFAISWYDTFFPHFTLCNKAPQARMWSLLSSDESAESIKDLGNCDFTALRIKLSSNRDVGDAVNLYSKYGLMLSSLCTVAISLENKMVGLTFN